MTTRGQEVTRKGKLVDEYIRQLSDLGISLHSLKLLGDFELSEEDKKLTEREFIEKVLTDSNYKKQKEVIERYILEFVRADLITQSVHLRRGKDLVNPYSDKLIDGGVYIYRTPEKDKDGNSVEIDPGQYDIMTEDKVTTTTNTNASTNTNTGNSNSQSNGSTSIQEVNQEKYVQMTYESPEKFQKLVDENSSKLRYKFTIDEDGNLVIAQLKTVVTKTKEKGAIFASTDKSTTVEDVLHIDYKKYIEKYTMPYEFLINLCMITQNPEFVYHVAMLARQTEIKLVVQDDTTIEDVTTTEEKTYESYKNMSSSSRSGAQVTSKDQKTIETEVITTTMVPHLEIKSANTWSFYETYEYTKITNVDGPNVQGPVSVPCDVPDTLPNYHPSTTQNVLALDMTYQTVQTPEYWTGGPWLVENIVTTSTTITTTKYNPGILKDSVEKSKQFLGLLRNSTGECDQSNCYGNSEKVKECAKNAVFDRNGLNVEYRLPNSTNKDAPLNRLISGLQVLYELLGNSLHGDSGNENQDEIHSEYKTKMTGIVEHLQYLMTFPDNEDIEIEYEDDEDDAIDIDPGDVQYEDDIEDDELKILYKICEAEAGGSKSEAEITHVACVILNRVKCSQWPNTIKEVVFQKNQFQPVRNGAFDKAVPSEKTKRAVDAAISGGDTTGGAVYFMTEKSAKDLGLPINKNEKHKSYIYLFTDPNTHVFHTDSKSLEELRGSTGGTSPATGKLEDVFPNGIPTTQEGIRKYLTTVQVPITRKDGTKTTAPVTIHKDVAQDLKNVLQKAQDAGFKVYSIGGFSWRNVAHSSKMSQHALGLAVDINVTENYCVYPSTGQIDAGSFWDPSRSEYSIPKDGVLVKAFKSIGWGWGGDWKSKKDYMHFSFTGN